MIFEPRDYQRLAISHLLDTPRGALWAGMGLGKTASTLVAFDLLRLAGEARRLLVIAPLRVARSTWPNEAAKWANFRHLSVQPITGGVDARLDALRNDRADVYTINYEQLPWLVERLGDDWPFDMVVPDESTRLKSFRLGGGRKRYLGDPGAVRTSSRAGRLAKVAHAPEGPRRWVNLTGTPAPNGLDDLWGQSWFLDAGRRLGLTHAAFTQRWFRPAHNGYGTEPLPHAQDEIQARLRDVCLTLRTEDWFDVSAPVLNTLSVELPPKARRLYDRFEKEFFAQLASGESVEALNAAGKSNKCLQLANGAVYYDDSGAWEEVHKAKLEALDSIIEEAAGAPVLVAYQYRSDLTRLQKHLGKRARVLDTDPATEAAWNAGRIPVLLAHPASAGHGLNLQDGGNILAFFGLTWNLEHYQQIIERIGPVRQLQAGHPRSVHVHHIIARGTVDEIVMQRLETKRSVQELLLEAMKSRTT